MDSSWYLIEDRGVYVNLSLHWFSVAQKLESRIHRKSKLLTF